MSGRFPIPHPFYDAMSRSMAENSGAHTLISQPLRYGNCGHPAEPEPAFRVLRGVELVEVSYFSKVMHTCCPVMYERETLRADPLHLENIRARETCMGCASARHEHDPGDEG